MDKLPATIQTISYNSHYDTSFLEVMAVRNIPMPVVSHHSVLIKVHATSVNPIDWKIAKGYINISADFPVTPCMDFAGVVVDIGDNCRRIRIGDEVYGLTQNFCGAAAEYISVHEDGVALKPDTLSFSEAASLPLVGLVAFQNLHGLIDGGSKVLVIGGSGGHGSFAIQLAKTVGCYVASTCSERNVELLKELGVDLIIDYQKEKWYDVLNGKDFDVVYDCIGDSEAFTNSANILRDNGHYVAVATDDDKRPTLGQFIAKGLSFAGRRLHSVIRTGPQYDYLSCDPTEAWRHLNEISSLVKLGAIRPVMEKVVPFEEFDQAIDFCESHKVRGKVCVQLVPEDTFAFRMKKYAHQDIDVLSPKEHEPTHEKRSKEIEKRAEKIDEKRAQKIEKRADEITEKRSEIAEKRAEEIAEKRAFEKRADEHAEKRKEEIPVQKGAEDVTSRVTFVEQ